MWKVFILLNLAALHCTVCSTVPSPVNVIFSSVNLRNVLQWQPGNGTPSDRHFTVQYAIYGDSSIDSKGTRARWRAVQRCTGIVQCSCDLSNELWDVEQGYFARVRSTANRASSKWALTRRFDPKSDTSFGPPLFSVEIENSNALITLKGPIRYQPNHEKPVVHMATLYPQMMYNLSIHNTRRSKMSHIIVNSDLYKYKLMEYDTEYCFSAKTKFLSMPVQCESSAWHCITTPRDPMVVQLQRIILSTAIPFVLICALVLIIYRLYRYLNGSGQKTPSLLNAPFTYVIPVTPPPEETDRLRISNRQLNEEPPPYAPHMLPAPGDAEPPSDDETIDYGLLAFDLQQRQNDGEVEQPMAERRVEEMPEGSGRQRVCTDNASQNLRDLPIISDCTIDDYGVGGLAACGTAKNYDEQEEDELDEETSFIYWDPRTRKLMLPEIESALSGKVLLESVFVRQSSEEAAEAQAKLDTAVETERKLENFLSGWDLVVAMDE